MFPHYAVIESSGKLFAEDCLLMDLSYMTKAVSFAEAKTNFTARHTVHNVGYELIVNGQGDKKSLMGES